MGSCYLFKELEKVGSHLIEKLFKEYVLRMMKELCHVTDLRPYPIAAPEASLHSVADRRKNGHPIITEQFYIHEDDSSSSLEAEQSITANTDPEKEISTRSVYTYGYLYYI